MPRLRTSSGILRRKEDQLLRITPEILRIFGNPDKKIHQKCFFIKTPLDTEGTLCALRIFVGVPKKP